ncbi:hypothetical protein [Gynuella sunshinyii]|uniref:DUF1998 domain-containing protein n=1 Tax=Gynuella sunshinyii YC6258 TaxID=1445510 RepID=A0A0C5VFZ0_9GAMM|nr:hypothetical protein [Gynuella sunshinyii]AJQ92293.1 hypothetical Protein YC6258_00241 [Gynuella sunshinyii YC6258]
MKDQRSSSQVIFGFLPNQTVDLKGKVWKVKNWRAPIRLAAVDTESLRHAILQTSYEWERNETDRNGFLSHLRKGGLLEAYALDVQNGVDVEPFPNQWVCRKCRIFHENYEDICSCGNRTKAQIPFVAYHTCGELKPIQIPKCPTHRRTRVEMPRVASLNEIAFSCPDCTWRTEGMRFFRCSCGENMKFNIHRAAKVYTPSNIVIVNPPVNNARDKLRAAGGGERAISWFIDGMKERSVDEVPPTRSSIKEMLITQGIPVEKADIMTAYLPEQAGEDLTELKGPNKKTIEEQATTIGLASLDSRLMLQDLQKNGSDTDFLKEMYSQRYPEAMGRTGILAVDLFEKFPIFTGHFAYTRGSFTPGEATLCPFPHHDRKQYKVTPVYGDLAETESLLIRLDPQKILKWLSLNGIEAVSSAETPKDCYKEILHLLCGEQGELVRNTLHKLIHSFSHRFIRTLAVYAGIDRNGLGEIILETALSFVIYSVPRGDFVLGGMHAVFERELDKLLGSVADWEHRCALDPGCSNAQGACMACLHIGEPSCAHFNRNLSRKTLFGPRGYLSVISRANDDRR